MIHQIHSYLPDGKTYMIKSDCHNVMPKTFDDMFVFSMYFEIRLGKSPEKYGMILHLKRMLR